MKWRLWSNAHNGWWRAHGLGYTSKVEEAGEFGTVFVMQRLMRACDDVEWDMTHDEPRTIAVNVESGRRYVLVEWDDDDPDGGTPVDEPIRGATVDEPIYDEIHRMVA